MSTKAHQPWKLTATEALQLIRDGELTCREWTDSVLSRITEVDQDIKAWVYLEQDMIRSNADNIDHITNDRRLPLHGLPIGIKDIILTRDMPTQYNSRLCTSTTPIQADAAVVKVLRHSGALIFGKLSTTEFATTKQGDWHQNRTRNAHSLEHTPGGSSSGSAAAVASYQIPIAVGTQTGGSIIRPASYNGCYGWKPTWNVISREGIGHWCSNLDTCGFFARSVDDLELMADVFRLPGAAPLASFKLQSARIAFCGTHNWPRAGNGTRNAMEHAKRAMQNAGANVTDLVLPEEFAKAWDWHTTVLKSEGRSSFLGQYCENKTLLHEDVQAYVESELPPEDIVNALDQLAVLRPTFDAIARQYDAILTPSVPDEAPIGLAETGDMSFCSMWTALHVPALNIPFFRGESNLPIGLTLVGPRMSDRQVLRTAKVIAAALEQS